MSEAEARIEIIEGEGELIEPVEVVRPVELRWYVAGEQPGDDQERALVPVRWGSGPISTKEILEAFREWMRLDVADGNPSPETVRSYFGDVKQHLGWLREMGLGPAQAGEEALKEYRAWLVERYAVSTAGRKLAAVRRFYQMAVARGILRQNPAEGLKAPRDRTARHERVKYLTMETVRRLFAAPLELNYAHPEKGVRDRAMLVLMGMHGLRVMEVHRMDLEDVDMEAGEAGEVEVWGKGDKRRTILLTEETREVLKMWLAARALMRPSSAAIFLTMHWNNGGEAGRLSRRGIREMVDRYLRAIGAKRPGVSCHSLRHSYATLSLAAGAQLLAISGSLGHAQLTTTQIYTRIVDKARHNPAKLLGGLLE